MRIRLKRELPRARPLVQIPADRALRRRGAVVAAIKAAGLGECDRQHCKCQPPAGTWGEAAEHLAILTASHEVGERGRDLGRHVLLQEVLPGQGGDRF